MADFSNDWLDIYIGDCRQVLSQLPEKHFHCCVTSPPYFGLRDYQTGSEAEIGRERTPDEFVETMVEVFRDVWRVLRDDGVCWVNLGDSYFRNPSKGGSGPNAKEAGNGYTEAQQGRGRIDYRGSKAIAGGKQGTEEANSRVGSGTRTLKEKDLIGIPWRVALALQDDGWWLRDAIIWNKPSPMPGSQRDRCTSSYEFVFQLTKSARYFFDMEAIKEPAAPATFERNKYPHQMTSAPASTYCVGKLTGNMAPGADMKSPSTRIPRNVWTMANTGFSEAHFATFCVELPIRCIKASTSEKGCCPQCGAPWVRVVESERVPTRPGDNTKVKIPAGWDTGAGSHGTIHKDGRLAPEDQYRDAEEIGNRDPQRHCTETRTVGWQPGCECCYPAPIAGYDEGGPLTPIPCRVIDPFGGAGTTALAAKELGQHCTLIELSESYADMAKRRILKPTPAKNVQRVVPMAGQQELF